MGWSGGNVIKSHSSHVITSHHATDLHEHFRPAQLAGQRPLEAVSTPTTFRSCSCSCSVSCGSPPHRLRAAAAVRESAPLPSAAATAAAVLVAAVVAVSDTLRSRRTDEFGEYVAEEQEQMTAKR